MEFKINTKTFLGRLASVARAIDTKPHIPALGHFLISLDGPTLTIVGSNTEMRLTSTIELDEAEGSGKFLVEAKRFIDVITAAPDCTASFSRDGNTLTVTHSSGRFAVPCLGTDSYPEQTAEGGEPIAMEVPAKEVATAISLTSFAASSDQLRPQMCGVYFDATPDSLTCVATDTRIMSRYICRDVTPGVDVRFLIPTRPVDIIQCMLQSVKTPDAMVTFSITSHNITVSVGNDTLTTQYPKGAYPAYNRAIPADGTMTTTVTASRKGLSEAIGRVGVMAGSEGCVYLRLSAGTINVESRDTATGSEAEDALGCSLFGNDIRMAFNAAYLRSIVDTIPGEEVYLKMTDPGRPALILPTDEKINLTTLCTPMVIND